jgi:protein-S-isoprenylcysteine O-methyltransferase Ste14
MFNDMALDHYGNWGGVLVWVIIYGMFLFFVPFYRKSERKPAATYLAFILAYALEMFGIPMSMYMISWALGKQVPDGIFWGHTLNQYIGHWGMYICIIMNIIGIALVIAGWKVIHEKYWRHEEGKGEIVTTGIYKYIRHPQYTGFLLITLGMIFEWATIPLLVMWPILVVMYYKLARKEEGYMIKEFGNKYIEYRKKTSMFIPGL